MTRFTEANVSHLMLDADRQPPSVKLQKYRNQPQVVDGIKFASKAEARHYGELQLRVKAGEISGLELQPRYEIAINGRHICTYVADFRFWEHASRSLRVVDVKGVRTPVFALKKRLMLAIHRIEVIEIS